MVHWANKAVTVQTRGTPTRVAMSGENEETWIYTTDANRWCGIMPILIIPVPLFLPVCDDHDRIVFKDGEPVSSFRTQIRAAGFYMAIKGSSGGASGSSQFGCPGAPAPPVSIEMVNCVINGQIKPVPREECK